MEKSFLTEPQLACRWNVKTATLKQWRWSGQGPPYSKVSRLIMYWIHDVEEYEIHKWRRSTSDTGPAKEFVKQKEDACKTSFNLTNPRKKKGI